MAEKQPYLNPRQHTKLELYVKMLEHNYSTVSMRTILDAKPLLYVKIQNHDYNIVFPYIMAETDPGFTEAICLPAYIM